jgi:hypothetical protein
MPGNFLRPDNIRLLGGLVPAAKQDNDFLSGVLEINPVSGTVMDTHFGDTLTGRLNIPGVPFGKPVNPPDNPKPGAAVAQFVKPSVKFVRPLYSLHGYIVGYNIQTINSFLN